MRGSVGGAGAAALVVLLLAGCSPASPSPAPTVTVTAPPTTVTATPIATPTTSWDGHGCRPNDVPIPDDADTAVIGDVDETDSDATEFYSQSPAIEFGVHTSSGATIVQPDDLAGPGAHSGWMTRLAIGVVAVLDDGRTATLHAFVDCRFVETKGVDGQPYRFTLNGFGDVGTGVTCTTDVDGTKELAGVDAVRLADGRYRIDTTPVTISDDGLTATNGATTRGTRTHAASSPEVRAANTSRCLDVPKVGTSGE
jgi:hypothetical protein